MSASGGKTVIHIITRLIKGGADNNTAVSCAGLAGRGWKVILVIGREYSHDLFRLRQKGVEVEVMNNLIRPVSPLDDLISLFDFVRLCRKYKPDIVHTHTAKAGVIGRVGAKLAGVPHVVHGVHGSPLDSVEGGYMKELLTIVEKSITPITDYYITVGEEIFQKYSSQINLKTKNYKVVRSALDVDMFLNSSPLREKKREELGLNDDDVAVAMIGRVSPQKGYEHFIDQCGSLFELSDKYKFFAIGKIDNKSYYKKIKSISSQYLADKNITFIGQIEYEEMPHYMAAFDIIVHTALWEGLPRVVVEALIADKPVVTFDVEGVNEIIKHGKNGFIVPSQDVDKMCEYVDHLMKDDKIGKTSKKAKEINRKLADEFRLEKMIDGIEEVYRLIAKTDKQRG